MGGLEIVDTSAHDIHNYKLCAYKNIKQEGYKRKIEWLKLRFSEGLKLKVLYSADEGAVGVIEYIPGEYTWRAVEANGYMVIHCIFNEYRKYRGQGYGTLLVEESLRDAKKGNMHGVAVVTRKGTWMVGEGLFLKNGFEVIDSAPPDFELLTKQFDNSPLPKFPRDWEKRCRQYGSGLTIIRSDQCPYVTKSVKEITETAEKQYGITPNVVELENCRDAQNAPSAFATFSIVYGGRLVAEHPISNKRFTNIMDKEVRRHVA